MRVRFENVTKRYGERVLVWSRWAARPVATTERMATS
jgi:hypothetical protein